MTVAARPIAAPGASGQIYLGPSTYRGFSLDNTGATAAKVRIRDAAAASGIIMDIIDLGVGESAREWYPDGGIRADIGIYFELAAGTVEGSIRVG